MSFKNKADRDRYAKSYREKYHTNEYYAKKDLAQQRKADKLAAKIKTVDDIVRDGTEEATLNGGGR